jgi:hypothetical protein
LNALAEFELFGIHRENYDAFEVHPLLRAEW